MANLSQTAANVHTFTGASTTLVQAGEAITPGMPCYKKAADNKYYKADANAGQSEAGADGIAISYAPADGDYFVLQTGGSIDLGGTLTLGETYAVSNTAGAIAPIGDVTTGWYPTILGIARSASELFIDIQKGTVARA